MITVVNHTYQMPNLSRNIRERMRELRLSQKELAQRAGLSQVTIHKLVTGKSNATTKILDLARALGVDPDWLLNSPPGTPPAKEGITTERDSSNMNAAVIPVWNDAEPYEFEEHIPLPAAMFQAPTARLVAVVAKRENMRPTIRPGDTVIIDTGKKQPQSGKIAAHLVGGVLDLHRLVRNLDGSWTIRSDDESPEYRDEIISAETASNLDIVGIAELVIHPL